MSILHDQDTRRLLEHESKVRSIVDSLRQGKVDETYPSNIFLSLTNRCNQECVWCGYRDLELDEIPFSSVERLVANVREHGGQSSTLTGIVLQGWGEPTVHPQFMDAIRLMGQANIPIGLITNGIIVRYLDEMDSFEWVRVSLDVSNREQYEQLKKRSGENFDRIMKNIAAMGIKKDGTRLGVTYVLTKRNIAGIGDMTRRLRDLGVDYFFIRPVGGHPFMKPIKGTNLDSLKAYETDSFNVILWYEDRFRSIPGLFEETLPCYSHTAKTFIVPNGDVYQCQLLPVVTSQPLMRWIGWAFPSNYFIDPIGNINKDDFNDIWMSDRRKDQSRALLYGKLPYPCKLCCMYKYNQLLGEVLKGDQPMTAPTEVRSSGFI